MSQCVTGLEVPSKKKIGKASILMLVRTKKRTKLLTNTHHIYCYKQIHNFKLPQTEDNSKETVISFLRKFSSNPRYNLIQHLHNIEKDHIPHNQGLVAVDRRMMAKETEPQSISL